MAFAIGTSQSRISQIEADLNHLHRETLERISEALGISCAERNYLLVLVGYQDEPSLPDEKAVSFVVSTLSPLIDIYPYPAMLIDDSERVWYWNPFVIPVWGLCFGVFDKQEFASRVRGRRLIEIIFGILEGESRAQFNQNYFANDESIITRAVTMFWRAYCIHAKELSMKLAMS